MLGFLGGTGPEGRGIALRLGLAGEVVMIGSRDAARAEEAVRELKSLHNLSEVYGGLNEDAARMADVVFMSRCHLRRRGAFWSRLRRRWTARSW